MKKNHKLKVALFLSGVTLKKLEEQTGINKAYLSMALHGKFNLDADQRTKIASVLRKSESELF